MKIEALFSSILSEPVEAISDDTSPTNLSAWDSLKHLELVLAIEGAYSVKFSMPEISTLQSLGRIREVLAEKGVVV